MSDGRCHVGGGGLYDRRGGVLGLAVVILLVVAGEGWAQAAKSRPGRVVDNICMLGAGLKGEQHRECAIACDKAGVRMALLDEKAIVLYIR